MYKCMFLQLAFTLFSLERSLNRQNAYDMFS